MRIRWIAVMAVLVLPGLAACSDPPKVDVQAPLDRGPDALPDGVTVSGEGEVEGAPDTLSVDLAVTIKRPTVGEAVAASAEVSNAVVDAVKGQGVTEKDVQTRNYSVNQDFRYPQNGTAVPDGFRVNNTVTVRVRDLTAAGAVIDAATAAGGDDLRVDTVAFSTRERRTGPHSRAREGLPGRAGQGRAVRGTRRHPPRRCASDQRRRGHPDRPAVSGRRRSLGPRGQRQRHTDPTGPSDHPRHREHPIRARLNPRRSPQRREPPGLHWPTMTYKTPEWHPAFEEYCETIFELREDDVDVIQARIAERLDVSRPAVSEMIRRMEKADLVSVDHDAIKLTGEGAQLAEQRGAPPPPGRAVPHRHPRAVLGRGPRRGRQVGARHLRAGRDGHGPASSVTRPPARTATRSPGSKYDAAGRGRARRAGCRCRLHRHPHPRRARVHPGLARVPRELLTPARPLRHDHRGLARRHHHRRDRRQARRRRLVRQRPHPRHDGLIRGTGQVTVSVPFMPFE